MLDWLVLSRKVMLVASLLVLCLGSVALSSDPDPLTVMYRVWEEQPVGTKVGRLVDDLRQRGETGALEDFQVVEHGKALPFSINARDGTVSTLGQLDREDLCRGSDLCELAFSVLYRKGGSIHFLRVRVEVMDLNDHSPTFSSSSQEVELSETAALRMRIPLDRAVDPDAGPNGLQTYSLSVNQHFALDVRSAADGPKQAELVVIKELDREVQSSFELTLLAWDKGNPPKSGSTLVRVNVLDSNDNSPLFEDSTPTVELAEDTAQGTVVIHLKATDPDQGVNGEVEYSLSRHAPPGVQKLFSVHPQSGAVTLKGPLDYEAKHSYEVDIQARDLGPNAIPTHCKLHIKLRDVNDNAPRIHVTWTPPDSPVATVLEGAPEDTFLALVMVSDADSGDNGNVHAQIQHRSGHFRLKRIHGDNYMIVTNGTLDREKVMEYNLTLLAQDHGNPPLSCVRHLVVHVMDVNDNAPVFSQTHYRASIKENNDVGFQVFKVEASDVDVELSGRVSYSIQESNELGTPTVSFSIHPTSGVVTAQQSLDYEMSPTYSFIVEAVDHGHPPLTSTAMVLIEIQDVNDNYPVIEEPITQNNIAIVSVPVNTEKGEIVTVLGEGAEEGSAYTATDRSAQNALMGFLATTIKAKDPDSGLNGRLSFTITDGNPTGLFRLDDTTGQLFVNATNATELIGKTFTVDIAVSDSGSPRLVTELSLQVTFINLQDHQRNSASGDRVQLSFPMLMAICLGTCCLLLLLTAALVTTFCRPAKRDNHAYNCRTAESSYARHPRRPQKNIGKADIQLVPVLRGRREDPPEDGHEAQPLSPTPLVVEEHIDGQYSQANSISSTICTQAYPEGGATLPVSYTKTLRKPGCIELSGTLPRTPATPYRTLRRARNPSSSSALSQTSTLRRHGNAEHQAAPDVEETEPSSPVSQVATLRRSKHTDTRGGREAEEHRRMLRNLVRLSMAAFGENCIELSAASPEVQQVSQLLSLLREGQLQPRPNFRGNKYPQRPGRSGAQDADWLSTKDSGHGESEAGDMDWDTGRDSPIDPLLEEGYNNLLNNPDIEDTAWMARLSLPLTADYHDNVFVPNGPPSPEAHCPLDTLDSTSFSTFGKTPEKDGPLGGALLSEVNTLFNMLLTQKGDSQPLPSPDVLYRLSAAYRRSLGLDGAAAPVGAPNIPRNPGTPEKRSPQGQSFNQCP
ncbi:protocadherin-12 isoform X2 [Esox lucius]|uniref:protocadherin-12 isoform X2 n=1 Tax=Esox lucius TaxID=8010 RepID=UPI0014775E84|nr:protocadherin-12 isoform X2 [Esox lucius]